MLLSAVSVLVVAQSSSEIPEGLTNNPVDCLKVFKIVFLISMCCCSHFVLPHWFANSRGIYCITHSDDAAAVPVVVILRDLLTTGELMMGLWQSTVPCGEMREGEMCWTLQAGDDVLEDTSEPQLWKEHSSSLVGLIICEVPSWEEQGDQALILRLGRNSGVSCCAFRETDIMSLQDRREIEGWDYRTDRQTDRQ